MTKQQFIDLILSEIESEQKATPNTELSSIDGWDSLATMITIGISQDNFNTLLTAPQLRDCNKFDDIIKLIGHDRFNG